ncbi:MAG: S8 family serine peptidase [Gemmatimonadota bacterium]
MLRILLRPRLSLAALVLLAAPLTAQTGPHIDPALRSLMRPTTRNIVMGAAFGPGQPTSSRPFAGLLALQRESGVVWVGLFARITSTTALNDLRAAGAEIGTRVGDIVTARVPVSALPQLATSRRIRDLQAAHEIPVVLDSSRKAIRADEVRGRVDGTWLGSAGQNVIVGLYDTGIDYGHDDFRDAKGRTRLLGLWDQTVTGAALPTGFNYGSYCDTTALNAGTCNERDTAGHGTHVAGIAAGDGSAGDTPYRYSGIAPAADILAVKGGNGSFSDNRIVDGVSWLMQEADRQGEPIVVILSLGGQYGPHDGTLLFEQALTNLTGPGKLLVVASGNEGSNLPPQNELIHAMGLPQVGVPRSFTFTVPSYTPSTQQCANSIVLDMWHDFGDTLQVQVDRPDGSSLTISAPAVPGADSAADNASGGDILILTDTAPDPENGDNEVYIEVSNCRGHNPASGTWTLQVTPTTASSGRYYHMWLYSSNLGGQSAYGATGFDNAYVVGAPGTATGAITVGAYATRMTWPSENGSTYQYSQTQAIGELAVFSSGGPRRDGVLKPEIVAPGFGIISTLSSTAQNVPVPLIAPDGKHWILQGTSMAAPHTAGVAALLLQYNPSLTAADVRNIFSSTADHDIWTGRTYSNAPGTDSTSWWGYGKLDAYTALTDVTNLANPAQIAILPGSDTMGVTDTLALRGVVATAAGDSVPGAPIAWASRNPAVATVDANGSVIGVAGGSTYIVASYSGLADSMFVMVIQPSTLIVSAQGVAPPERLSSEVGTTLPLVRIDLKANGSEGIRVEQLGFTVTGRDPGATLLLVDDAARNGVVDPTDRIVADSVVALAGDSVNINLQISSFVVPAQDSVALIAALRMSGSAPNGATFQMTFVPSATQSVGVLSGSRNRQSAPGNIVASPVASTTLLQPGESFAISENPVKSDAGQVIFNFDPNTPPNLAAIYTLDGRRVVDLMPLIEGGSRAVWPLTNDDGSRVAPGIYILVVRFADSMIRKKLFIARSGGDGDGE